MAIFLAQVLEWEENTLSPGFSIQQRVFCCDRSRYYDHLSEADTGTREGMLSWCRYVLEGIKTELDKIESLLDYSYLRSKVIQPALMELHRKNGISDHERAVLLTAIEKGPVQKRGIRSVLGGLSQVQVSRILQCLRERDLLHPLIGIKTKLYNRSCALQSYERNPSQAR